MKDEAIPRIVHGDREVFRYRRTPRHQVLRCVREVGGFVFPTRQCSEAVFAWWPFDMELGTLASLLLSETTVRSVLA